MKILNAVVLTAALGTFVDILDLTLFQSVRIVSLRDLGVAPADLFPVGAMLMKVQLLGLVLGGILWGIIADRRGRRSVLFASILTYSLATLANAWVTSVPMYAIVRFIAGIGLAGELGAGITLIVEVMPKETRGYGTTLCAAAGVSGALGGALIAAKLPWRTDYIIGGCLGLSLFLLRATTYESKLFQHSKEKKQTAQKPKANAAWFGRYVAVLAAGLPLFFVLLMIAPFAPEFGKGANPPHLVSVALATGTLSVAMTLGDVGTGLLSQKMKSRKKPILICILGLAVLFTTLFFVPIPSDGAFIAILFLIGLCAGYFVLFLTIAAEQFGTNMRGRAAVLAPNIMRGLAIPMTIGLERLSKGVGFPMAGALISGTCILFALVALRTLPETFGTELDYDE
jgi:putative MFS transporter